MDIMGIHWIEWVGYLASLIVLISLTMRSIIRLRVYNFIGCMVFAYYGYLTGLVPVSVANLSIALINIYYLYHIFTTKEQFKLVIAEPNSAYFNHFLESNKKEVELQIYLSELGAVNTSFYMLRDENIAGVLVGNKGVDGEFEIKLDFVIPSYRDYKLGDYYYNTKPEILKEYGITSLKADAKDISHSSYLEKIGFRKLSNHLHSYTKQL